VFIHGLWLHASSWKGWQERFRAAGYEPAAPGWPNEAATVDEARVHPEAVAGQGIDEVTDHFAEIIRGLDAKPVVVGHSFGGLIAEKLLGENLAVAAVAIDPAQIKGVLPLPLEQLKAGFPVLGNPANLNRAVMLTEEQFHYGFGNAITPEESAELYKRWVIPSPAKPLFQAAVANFNPNSSAKVDTHNATRGPLLLIAGGSDHTVPSVVTHAAFKLYHEPGTVTDIKDFPDRGHSLVVDSKWEELADSTLAWLKTQGL
jgi:alpha-beta hydrolase superfamily lysophospholipase